MKKGKWVTINGVHIFIEEGQSIEDAFRKLSDRSKADSITELNKLSTKELKEIATGLGSIIPGRGEPAEWGEKKYIKLPLNYFGMKGHKQPDLSVEIPPVPKEAFGFENKKRLNTKHHKKHKMEMHYKDEKAYNQAAIDLWNKDDGELYYSERRGNFCKIGRDGVTVCFCSTEGIIGSFYQYSSKAETRQFIILERLIKI